MKKVEEVVRKKLTCEKSFFYFLHKSNKAMSHGTKIFKKHAVKTTKRKGPRDWSPWIACEKDAVEEKQKGKGKGMALVLKHNQLLDRYNYEFGGGFWWTNII